MERLEEYIAEPTASHGVAMDEPAEFLEPEPQQQEKAPDEPVSTDDPVRVYLREMGSVRLLTRQGEIDLARQMERGKLRVRKALSRSPLVQQMAAAIHDDLRQAKVQLEDLVEAGASAEKHPEITRQFTKVAKLNRSVQ